MVPKGLLLFHFISLNFLFFSSHFILINKLNEVFLYDTYRKFTGKKVREGKTEPQTNDCQLQESRAEAEACRRAGEVTRLRVQCEKGYWESRSPHREDAVRAGLVFVWFGCFVLFLCVLFYFVLLWIFFLFCLHTEF